MAVSVSGTVSAVVAVAISATRTLDKESINVYRFLVY